MCFVGTIVSFIVFNKFNVAKMSLKNLFFLKNRWKLWNKYTRYSVLKMTQKLYTVPIVEFE